MEEIDANSEILPVQNAERASDRKTYFLIAIVVKLLAGEPRINEPFLDFRIVKEFIGDTHLAKSA